MQFKFSTHVCE